jgi:hypothetical protein
MLIFLRNLFFTKPAIPLLSAPNGRSAEDLESVRSDITHNHKEMQRQMRRMILGMGQQEEKLAALEKGLSLVRAEIRGENALVLKTDKCIEAFDRLSELMEHLEPDTDAHQLAGALASLLQAGACIRSVCVKYEPYPDSDCEVLGSVVNNDLPSGTVLNVIQQGYVSASGSTLRRAKVMVSTTEDLQ